MPITTEMVAFAVTVLVALAAVWWQVDNKINKRFDEAYRERQKVKDDLAAYKLHVAQNHPSLPTLKETEDRLIGAIDKLGNRLETVVAHLEKLSR